MSVMDRQSAAPSPRDSELSLYVRQIGSFPRLSALEEAAAVSEYRQRRCPKARERLICGNLRLVIFAARRYTGLGTPLADLVEAGNLGLLQAVDRYDPDQGCRLSTYAMWWIRRAMMDALRDHAGLVRVPEDQRRVRKVCRESRDALAASLGRPPTDDEVAGDVGLTAAELREIDGLSVRCTTGEGEAAAVLDSERAPDAIVSNAELRKRVRGALSSLPEEHATIVRLRFGLDGQGGLTLGEVTRELGLSASHVLHVLDDALRRLAAILSPDEDHPESPQARPA